MCLCLVLYRVPSALQIRVLSKYPLSPCLPGHTLPSLVKNASLQGIFRPRPTTSYLVLQPNKSRTCSFQSLILLSGHFVGAPRIAFSVDQLCRGEGVQVGSHSLLGTLPAHIYQSFLQAVLLSPHSELQVTAILFDAGLNSSARAQPALPCPWEQA